jgi:hypothetical protein
MDKIEFIFYEFFDDLFLMLFYLDENVSLFVLCDAMNLFNFILLC